MNVVINANASDDLVAIGDYIAQDSAAFARITIAGILADIARLRSFPLLGRHGVIEGTRELVVRRSFIVVYRARDDQDIIEIIAVARAAQSR